MTTPRFGIFACSLLVMFGIVSVAGTTECGLTWPLALVCCIALMVVGAMALALVGPLR